MSRPLNRAQLAGASPAELMDLELPGSAPALEARLAGEPAALGAVLHDWHKLAGSSLDHSIIASPQWLVPLFQHMRGDQRGVDVLLVERSARHRQLRGVVPFKLERFRWGLPLPVMTSWLNDLFFIGVPLIRKAAPLATLKAALTHAGRGLGARGAMFRMVPRNGGFAEALRMLARDEGLAIAEFEPFERAGLQCDTDFETWFQDSFSRKRRKEFRRLRTRLGEQGVLDFSVRSPGEALGPWLDEFLHLEQAGWKGDTGTAVACLEDISKFLSDALAGFDAAGRLLFWKLTLDGKPIASLFGIVDGRKAWLIKIAYDEDHARFSPGVLLMLDVTRDLLARGDIDLVDSSAVPDHPMINHLWRDRLAMTDIMIATPGTPELVFGFMATAERWRRQGRQLAKTAYHRLKKRGSK